MRWVTSFSALSLVSPAGFGDSPRSCAALRGGILHAPVQWYRPSRARNNRATAAIWHGIPGRRRHWENAMRAPKRHRRLLPQGRARYSVFASSPKVSSCCFLIGPTGDIVRCGNRQPGRNSQRLKISGGRQRGQNSLGYFAAAFRGETYMVMMALHTTVPCASFTSTATGTSRASPTPTSGMVAKAVTSLSARLR
jgi:hypothetical protein